MNTSYADSAFEQQQLLAGYCRTGEQPPVDGVRADRVHHYRDLVFNVVQDTLDTAYPLTKAWMEEEDWETLVHEFFSRHKCQSAQVWKMPFEFYEWVCQEPLDCKNQYAGLEELLLLEWMEIEVFMMEDIPVPHCRPVQQPTIDPLVIHPEYKIITLSYPFHIRNASEITEEDQGLYYVLLYRHPLLGEVIFFNLQPLQVWMLLQLQEAPQSIQAIAGKALFENPALDETFLYQTFQSFYDQLDSHQLISGTT